MIGGNAEGSGGHWDAFGWLDRIPDVDVALRQDLGAQPAPVHEAFEDATPRQALEVGARFAETHATQADVAHPELPPDQVVQCDPARHDVPAGVPRCDLGFVVAGHRLDRLDLDERDLAAGARPVRVRAHRTEIAVSLEAPPRDRADRPHGAHRAFRLGRDVDRGDLARTAAHGSASGITASTSISTRASGSTSRPTSTSVEAGRMSRKNSADDVLQTSPRLLQGRLDLAEDVHRLAVRVPRGHDPAVGIRRRRAGDDDPRSHAHRPRVSDDRLPFRPGSDVPSLHDAGDDGPRGDKASAYLGASAGGHFRNRVVAFPARGPRKFDSSAAASSATFVAASHVPRSRHRRSSNVCTVRRRFARNASEAWPSYTTTAMVNSPRTAMIPRFSYRIAVIAYPRDPETLVSTKFPTTDRRPSSCSASIGRVRPAARATSGSPVR